jgi:uncharacterized protein YcfJ
MKLTRIAFATLAATAAFAAAAQEPVFMDRARVQRVEPQYETAQVPREECASQWVSEARPVAGDRNYTGVVVGGIAGGILGNQVGKGHGREAATAAGAVIGAIAGDRIANQNNPQPVYTQGEREVRSCRTVYDAQTRVNGYRVTYEYDGRSYTTFTREHPGQSLAVRVSVTPVEAEYHRR